MNLQQHIIEQIIRNFNGKEFVAYRSFLRRIIDHQSFFTANILAILDHCSLPDGPIQATMKRARQTLKSYQTGHLTYHWPLRHGKSVPGNAPVLSRIPFIALSPDADCSCMQQIVFQDTKAIEAIIKDLQFYRVDNITFTLPEFQKPISGAEQTFLTWFPPRHSVKAIKTETIDITVDANILWFLSKFNRLDIEGAQETLSFIGRTLESDSIIRDSFRISPYYPFPLVILYFLSRAIHWGKISGLYAFGRRILHLTDSVPAKTPLQYLLKAAIHAHWQDNERAVVALKHFFTCDIQPNPFFVSPLLLPLTQRWNLLYPLARNPVTFTTYSCAAMQWAIALWVVQKTGLQGSL